MNGNVSLHDRCGITAYNSMPANLTWYQASGTTFTSHNTCVFRASMYGPNAIFVAADAMDFMGRMIFNNITTHDGAEFYVDETLSGGSGSGTGLSSISSVR